MSIFLLCSFLKGNAWSVFADHIHCRILEVSLYQVKQGVCTPNLLSGRVFKFAAGCCTLSSPSTGSVRTIALHSPRSSSQPVSASAQSLQGHLWGPTFPFLLSRSWGPIVISLKLERGMDWALQGLLRCFPPDGADSQGPGHLVGLVGPSLHAQGGSEHPARPSPSSYILPALRFPMKMQLPALGQKPLSPPAAAAAPGS